MRHTVYLTPPDFGKQFQNRGGSNEGYILSREEFYQRLLRELGYLGLLSIHEGTLLNEQPFEKVLTRDAVVIDSAEAPRDRDLGEFSKWELLGGYVGKS